MAISLFVDIQDGKYEKIVIPKNKKDPTLIYAISLLRTINFNLSDIISVEDPMEYLKDDKAFLLDIGNGKYDSYRQPEKRVDGSRVSCLTLLWKDLEDSYVGSIKNTFKDDIILPIERKETLYKYINKIMGSGTDADFVLALRESYHFLKLWVNRY